MDKTYTTQEINYNPDNHRRNYYEVEEQILRAVNLLLKQPGGEYDITISEIAQHAGLSRRAVYNHFDNANSIFRENVEKMLDLTKAVAGACRSREDDARKFLWNFMLMICRNSTRFKIEHIRDRHCFWKLALPEIKDLLTQDWPHLPKSVQGDVFRLYCAEFIAIMNMWGEDGFSISSLEHYLRYLIRLTTKAPDFALKIIM